MPDGALTMPRRRSPLAPTDFVTLAALMLLYSNAPAVASQFHGLPSVLSPAIGLLLLLPLIDHLFLRGARLIVTPTTLWVLAFLLVQLASLATCGDAQRAAGQITTTACEGFGIVLLVTNVVRNTVMLRRVTWALVLVGAFSGALSAFQFASKTFTHSYGGFGQVGTTVLIDGRALPFTGGPLEQRPSGFIGESNRYAQVMLILAPLGFFLFQSETRPVARLAAAGATLLALLGVVVTFSRGAAVGFVLMLATVMLLRCLSLRQCALLLGAGALVVLASPSYAERLLTLGRLENSLEQQDAEDPQGEVDRSIQGRDTELRAALLMFTEHPLLGVGPGLYPKYYLEYAPQVGGRVREVEREAHSLYVGMAAELGVLGIGVFLAMVVDLSRRLVRAIRRSRRTAPREVLLACGYLTALAAYLSTALFLHFSYERYFWLILALAAVAVRTVPPPPHARQGRRGG